MKTLRIGQTSKRMCYGGKMDKNAEFGYPVTKFISDPRNSSDRFVERISHIMTVYQTGVSVHFVRWKVLKMLKT